MMGTNMSTNIQDYFLFGGMLNISRATKHKAGKAISLACMAKGNSVTPIIASGTRLIFPLQPRQIKPIENQPKPKAIGSLPLSKEKRCVKGQLANRKPV